MAKATPTTVNIRPAKEVLLTLDFHECVFPSDEAWNRRKRREPVRRAAEAEAMAGEHRQSRADVPAEAIDLPSIYIML